MHRLCEDCGEPTGFTFYVVKYAPAPVFAPELQSEKAVCFDCVSNYIDAREVTETQEQLDKLEGQIKTQLRDET